MYPSLGGDKNKLLRPFHGFKRVLYIKCFQYSKKPMKKIRSNKVTAKQAKQKLNFLTESKSNCYH